MYRHLARRFRIPRSSVQPLTAGPVQYPILMMLFPHQQSYVGRLAAQLCRDLDLVASVPTAEQFGSADLSNVALVVGEGSGAAQMFERESELPPQVPLVSLGRLPDRVCQRHTLLLRNMADQSFDADPRALLPNAHTVSVHGDPAVNAYARIMTWLGC